MSEELLHTCGLNHNEQELLLSLLSRGDAPAAALAKRVGLKRTNVYAVLENLLSAGLITKRPRNSVTWFSAVEPARMTAIFEAKAKQQYQSVCSAAELLQPTLSALASTAPRQVAGFQLNSIESSEGVRNLLEELLLSGNFAAIFNPQTTLTPENKKVVTKCLAESAETAPLIREIAVEGPMTDWYRRQIKNTNHQLKEISADKHIWSDIILYNGIVTLLHYEAPQEVAFRISHEDYYESMMCIFEMLWEKL